MVCWHLLDFNFSQHFFPNSILFGFPMQPKMSPTLVLVAVSASLDLCLHLSRRSRGHFLSPPFSPYLFSRCRFASCPNGWFLSCWFTHSYLPLHVFLTHDWQLCTAMFYVGACCLGSALVYFFFWTYYFLSTCAYYISKLQGSFFLQELKELEPDDALALDEDNIRHWLRGHDRLNLPEGGLGRFRPIPGE